MSSTEDRAPYKLVVRYTKTYPRGCDSQIVEVHSRLKVYEGRRVLLSVHDQIGCYIILTSGKEILPPKQKREMLMAKARIWEHLRLAAYLHDTRTGSAVGPWLYKKRWTKTKTQNRRSGSRRVTRLRGS